MADQARRELLMRLHNAIGSALFSEDLNLIWFRFRTNHRIGEDHPLGAELDKVIAAHRERVAGRSSPAECDKILREMAHA